MSSFQRLFTVKQFVRYFESKLYGDPILSRSEIVGEVTNLTRSSRGHFYFALSEGDSLVPMVMFAKGGSRVLARVKNGDRLTVVGRLDYYRAGGRTQFVVERAKLSGEGLLLAQIEALKEKLEAEGIFDLRQQVLPRFPKVVGVVTSGSGAVWHDIRVTIERHNPLVELRLFESSVQGDRAVIELCQALDKAYQDKELEAIIIARGGGSLEDLMAFNQELVLRKMVESKVPLISAVGHETDTTLSDRVADYRAATPTAGAEEVCWSLRRLEQWLERHQLASYHALMQCCRRRSRLLHRCQLRLLRLQPQKMVEKLRSKLSLRERAMHYSLEKRVRGWRNHLTRSSYRLDLLIRNLIKSSSHRWATLSARLESYHPERRWPSGLAQVWTDKGEPLEKGTAVEVGDRLKVLWPHHKLWVRVEEVFDE